MVGSKAKNEAQPPPADSLDSSKARAVSDTDEVVRMLSLEMVDSKYSWFIVFCSFFSNMIVDGMQYTFSNFLTPILITFNSSTMAVSLIGSLLSGFYNFSGPIAGALANKFGFRMVTITGAIIAASGLSSSYFASDIRILYLTYGIIGGTGNLWGNRKRDTSEPRSAFKLLSIPALCLVLGNVTFVAAGSLDFEYNEIGLGFGMIYMSAVITTSLYFDKYRALAASISVCGTGIGTFVFSPFGNFLVNMLGWRLALVVEGGMVLLCILFGLAFKSIDIISLGPLMEERDYQSTSLTTIRTIKTVRESGLMPNDSKILPNTAYPTLRQALAMQGVAGLVLITSTQMRHLPVILVVLDEDGRRSLYSRSARASIATSLRQSLILGPVISDSYDEDEEELVDRGTLRWKIRRRYQRFCYNFWHCQCGEKTDLTIGDRPMYRDDVFYEGSLAYLRDKSDRINYHLSVIRIPDEKDAMQHRQQKICGCHEAILRTFVTMIGLNLLKEKTFVFLCLSSFMYTMGVFIPYMFLRTLAESENIEQEKSIWLVSSIGISNTAGRLFCGVLISCVQLDAALIVFFCTLISSLSCLIVLLPIVPWSVFTFAVAFGFFTAPFVSLRPVVIVEFLGLERLTNAFGLVLLSQGIASILGPPLAGMIDSSTHNPSLAIIFAGSLLFVSASSILVSTLVARRK